MKRHRPSSATRVAFTADGGAGSTVGGVCDGSDSCPKAAQTHHLRRRRPASAGVLRFSESPDMVTPGFANDLANSSSGGSSSSISSSSSGSNSKREALIASQSEFPDGRCSLEKAWHPLQFELQSLESGLRARRLCRQDMLHILMQRSLRLSATLGEAAKVFSFDSPDEHIRKALHQRNGSVWIENRRPGSQLWNLRWCATDSEADYRDLGEGDLYNHFQNNHELTTKVGLSRSLRRLAVDERVDVDAFFPRCYDMGVGSEREDFVLDFRRSAAFIVAKSHTAINRSSERPSMPDNNLDVLRTVTRVLEHWLKDLDPSHLDEDSSVGGLNLRHEDWDAIVVYSAFSDPHNFCQEDGDQRRNRNRGYTASGGTQELLREGLAKVRSCQRSSDVRLWSEFRDHEWAPILPSGIFRALDSAVSALERQWAQASTHGPQNIWIVKPGTGSKGHAIVCMSSLPEILHHCKTSTNRIVQKYIERPLLLFGGRKFDIRQWVLVRSFDPLHIFAFSSCYLRLCNEPFDLGDLTNRQRHISNWAVNKHGRHVLEGAVASLDDLRDALARISGNERYWEDALKPTLHNIIVHTLRSVQHNVVQRSASFELYGFDFILDDGLNPWLLEVNLSPACESRTPWISAMLERMATRLLDIVLDGRSDSDGLQPDWELVLKEEEHHHKPAVESERAAYHCRATSTCLDTASARVDLAIVGHTLNLRSERRFESAWKRRCAQRLIVRVARGFLARRRAWRLRLHRAILQVQQAVRRWIGRRLQQRQRLLQAQLVVLRHARCFCARALLLHCRHAKAAIHIQRHFRGLRGRRRASAHRKLAAAIRIQRLYRKCRNRKEELAQQKIAAWWRDEFVKRVVAAVHLQAAYHGWTARMRVRSLRANVVAPTHKLSRTLACARWRRRLILVRAHLAALNVQRRWRSCVVQRQVRVFCTLKQVLSQWRSLALEDALHATVLQKYWRGKCAKHYFRLARIACMKLQTAWRAHRQKIETLWLRSNAMAARLQQAWRGHARRQRRKRREAAVRLQAAWRGIQARVRLTSMPLVATFIQAAWRGFLARRVAAHRRRFLNRKRRWLASAISSDTVSDDPATQAGLPTPDDFSAVLSGSPVAQTGGLRSMSPCAARGQVVPREAWAPPEEKTTGPDYDTACCDPSSRLTPSFPDVRHLDAGAWILCERNTKRQAFPLVCEKEARSNDLVMDNHRSSASPLCPLIQTHCPHRSTDGVVAEDVCNESEDTDTFLPTASITSSDGEDEDADADAEATAGALRLLQEAAQALGRPTKVTERAGAGIGVCQARPRSTSMTASGACQADGANAPDVHPHFAPGVNSGHTLPAPPALTLKRAVEVEATWLATPRRPAEDALNIVSGANDVRFDWPPAPTPRRVCGDALADAVPHVSCGPALPKQDLPQHGPLTSRAASAQTKGQPCGSNVHESAPALRGSAFSVARQLRSSRSHTLDTARSCATTPPTGKASRLPNSAISPYMVARPGAAEERACSRRRTRPCRQGLGSHVGHASGSPLRVHQRGGIPSPKGRGEMADRTRSTQRRRPQPHGVAVEGGRVSSRTKRDGAPSPARRPEARRNQGSHRGGGKKLLKSAERPDLTCTANSCTIRPSRNVEPRSMPGYDVVS